MSLLVQVHKIEGDEKAQISMVINSIYVCTYLRIFLDTQIGATM